MTNYSSNNFRPGLKIILEGEPYAIESSEFVKPGKGQAFTRVKMRRLLTGTRVEKTFKATDYVKGADIITLNFTYLYNDSGLYFFINKENFEQLSADKKAIGDNYKWMIHQEEYLIILWNNYPIQVIPPNFVELKVINTDPGIKGDTTNTSSKPATLSTRVVVKVPLFVQIGEVIKVDTRSGEYVSRIK
ncbi:elongation factor P [Candidatus Profftia sp. (ex Adelges kitamiensis)]|uniref:elongation factor P n=1 Tax=Candidatus Profftia sp. (ex Adelges kitamiensis) TaxID=2864218 RepID=UPI001CE263D6|nr:elongation factor P [Candidatus Profftia sp. (ex Adelges kitamiensis)]